MNGQRVHTFFVILLALLCCCSAAQAQQLRVLRGRVTDETGVAVVGASVSLHETRQGALTDSAGRFAISSIRIAAYHLHAEAPGYHPWSADLSPAAWPDSLVIVLRPTLMELDAVLIEGDVLKADAASQSLATEAMSQQQIQQGQQANPLFALARLPGVSVSNVGLGVARPVIRGMGLNRVAIVEGGIKMEGQQWAADHGLELDPWRVLRLEVLKGPAALAYGSDAMGGVLVVRPEQPPADGRISAQAAASYTSANQGLAATARVAGRTEGVHWLARYSTRWYGDYRVPADSFSYNRYILPIQNQLLKNTASREHTLNLAAGLDRRWGSFRLGAFLYDQYGGLFAGAVGIPRAYQLTDDGDSRNIALPAAQVQYVRLLANTVLRLHDNWLEADLAYQRSQRHELTDPRAHARPDSARLTPLAHSLLLHTFSAHLRYHHRLGHSGIQAVVGLQGQWQRHRMGGWEFLLPNYTQGGAAAYYMLKRSWGGTLTVNAGLRADAAAISIEAFADTVYTASGAFHGVVQRTAGLHRVFGSASGSVGVAWLPRPHWQLKANLASAYRYPTASELAANGVHHGTYRHEQGSPGLNPEQGLQLDLVASLDRRRVSVRLTPFAAWYFNYLYLAPTAQFSFLPEGGQLYQYRQAAAVFAGGEAVVEARPAPRLYLALTLEGLLAQNMATGLPLPFIPPANALLEGRYDWKDIKPWLPALYLRAEVQATLPQDRVDRNERTTPGYVLLGAGAGCTFKMGRRQTLDVNLALNNLLDTAWYSHLSRYRQLNLPETGRYLVATLAWNLE